MDVKNCRKCGRIMQYSGVGEIICPDCKKKMDDKFVEAKAYLKENPGTNSNRLAEAIGVPLAQVNKWIREERLVFSDDSPIGIDCERCGKMIKSGRFCPECKAAMVNEFSSGRKDGVSVKPVSNVGAQSSKGRMRYLDR